MPAAAGPPTGQQWWVVEVITGKFGTSFSVAQGTEAQIRAQHPGAQLFGPFATRAQAVTEMNKQRQHQGVPGGGPPLPNPLGFLAWIQDVGHWIGVFVASITDIHMWISIGWLLLGGFLLLVGLWLWVRGTKFYQDFQKQAETAATVAAAA